MFINLSVKDSYIDKHWEPLERDNSRAVVKRYMMEYAEERDLQAELASNNASIQQLTTSASCALGRGLGRATRDADLDSLVEDAGVTPMRHRTLNMSGSSAYPPETPTRPSMASARSLLTPSAAAKHHRKMMVDLEHDRYPGLPDSKEYKDRGKVDLMKYWNLCEPVWILVDILVTDI
ncbi:hypothetical protein FRC12_017110 [Ceratobasidium sp. 428]|nr:hypothetical protein FRC12_017110 [Ceratobasidium sp. 428]